MVEPATSPDRVHAAAPTVLVALVVLAPWPFGSVHWTTTAAVAIVGLAVSLAVSVVSLWRRRELPLPRFAAPPWIRCTPGLANLENSADHGPCPPEARPSV